MVKIFKDPETLLIALADFIVVKAREAIERQGKFDFALSGGSSPKKLYELLASDSYRNQIEWSKVFFFFGDERFVPADHADSNYLMAKKALFAPLEISDSNIFAVDTTPPPSQSARLYEQSIVQHFKDRFTCFDFVLLGLGDNSHTASLFPHTSILHERKALVRDIFVEEVKMMRITFTATLINMARNVVFLVYGAGKAEAVKHILKDPVNIEEYPAQLIKPVNGDIFWFLDEGAAGRIV